MQRAGADEGVRGTQLQLSIEQLELPEHPAHSKDGIFPVLRPAAVGRLTHYLHFHPRKALMANRNLEIGRFRDHRGVGGPFPDQRVRADAGMFFVNDRGDDHAARRESALRQVAGRRDHCGDTAFHAEILVATLQPTLARFGFTELFVGVIVVALVGNAAEHYSAIAAARRDQMTLSVEIAVGSSAQIALLVAPVVVIYSFLIGRPMSLLFHPFEITAIALSVIATVIVTMRRFRIKVVPGDRVTVGVSPYDPVRGIITFRAR